MSNGGYEKVPDVEPEPPAAESSYADLADDQAALLKNIDNAMGMSKLDFTMPAVDPEELVSQGESMLQSMFLPTLTAAAMVVGGLALNYQAQYSVWAETAVQYFPYVSALLIFYSSFTPLSNRLKDAVKPVFDKSDKIPEDVSDKVGKITVQVDTTIDALQTEVGDVLKPIKPIIDNASSKAGPLKQMDPTLDIPDSSEIDEEFNELQGKIGGKVKEAQEALDLEPYIPGSLKSSANFYWQVMFPILILALVLQLGLAWLAAAKTLPSQTTVASAPTRYLRGGRSSYEYYYQVPPPLRHLKQVDVTPEEASDPATTDAETPIDEAKDEAVQLFDKAKEEVTVGVDVAEKDAQQAVDWVKEETSQGIDAAKEQVKAIQAEALTKQAGYELPVNQYESQKKGITISVLLSYLMALLQMGLLFLFTSPRVKASAMDKMMSKVSDQTNRTLREYGVTTTMEDVMGTRMGRIRQKLLKLFTSVGKIQILLDKIPSTGNAQIDRAEAMLGTAGKKQRSFLGGLFKR